MRKSTKESRRKRKVAIKGRNNRLKFLHKESTAAAYCRVNVVDKISQLPDEILISIISRLTLKEATATSILSTRWKHLYTYITSLNFPPFKLNLGGSNEYLQEIQEERLPAYINLINHTLDSYKGGPLKEFKVHMHCLEGVINVERWLEFALARGIEIIDIHLRCLRYSGSVHHSLQLSNLIKTNSRQSLPGLKCLKELSLSAVHIDDGEVELLLSNFPLLERLSIARSARLRNLLIIGHSALKLEYLHISYAWNLECIEIRNMIKLVSLRCHQLPSKYVLRLNNVPNLTAFHTTDKNYNTLADILPSCVRNQLLLLKVSTCHSLTWRDLPELLNVKHLELEYHMAAHNSAFKLISLTEACPSLEKLEVKFLWNHGTNFEQREICKWLYPIKELSPNFKELKLSGYLGSPSELDFALFIIKNVVALESLIVEPCGVTKRIRRTATARAWKHFRPIVPNSVNLVII